MDKTDQFAVFSQLGGKIGLFQALGNHEFFQLVAEEFVKNEAENVVFVFVGFDFGAHFVGGLPDFGGELLFVHGETPKRIDLMEKKGNFISFEDAVRTEKGSLKGGDWVFRLPLAVFWGACGAA